MIAHYVSAILVKMATSYSYSIGALYLSCINHNIFNYFFIFLHMLFFLANPIKCLQNFNPYGF